MGLVVWFLCWGSYSCLGGGPWELSVLWGYLGILDSMDVSLSKLWEIKRRTGEPGMLRFLDHRVRRE